MGALACAPGPWHPFYERRIRVEHWANALNQGPAAARSMLGEEVSYQRIPYFFSDQYDVGMEYSGYAERWDEVVLRGDSHGARCDCQPRYIGSCLSEHYG